MDKNSKKISPIVKDIKNSDGEFEDGVFNNLFKGKGSVFLKKKLKVFPAKAAAFGIVLAVAMVFFGLFLYYRNQTIKSATALHSSLVKIMVLLNQAESASSNGIPAESLNGEAGQESLSIFQAFAFFKDGKNFPSYLIAFDKDIDAAVSETETLKQNGMNWIFEDGSLFLQSLNRLESIVVSINEKAALLRNIASKFGLAGKMSSDYLSLQSGLYSAKDGIEGLTEILSGDSHLALVFENISEIRPAGGFNGSYADLAIKSGKIESFEVNDIFYPDQHFEKNIIPPKPLQIIAKSWGARDANWFFDFPTSAGKLVSFLDGSSVYADSQINFQGVIAVNSRAVERILKICGPIELPEYKLTLDENNFLSEIQEEVSLNSASKGNNRKQILKILAPKIVERMKNLDEERKDDLLAGVLESLADKDIRVYFKNEKLEKAAISLGFAGEAYDLPDGDYADYLAVANANVNGGKTDIFMQQQISLKSELAADGTIKNNLEIVRTHQGQNQKLSFYRSVNQNYIQILALKGVKAVKAAGNTVKKIVPKVNYVKMKYTKDADVESFESGFQSGKAVMGYWLDVKAGKTGKLSVEYERPSMIRDKFRFVYEKQSGVESGLKYEVSAPAGFIFAETGTSTFVYESENPPKRLIINLNLKQI